MEEIARLQAASRKSGPCLDNEAAAAATTKNRIQDLQAGGGLSISFPSEKNPELRAHHLHL